MISVIKVNLFSRENSRVKYLLKYQHVMFIFQYYIVKVYFGVLDNSQDIRGVISRVSANAYFVKLYFKLEDFIVLQHDPLV